MIVLRREAKHMEFYYHSLGAIKCFLSRDLWVQRRIRNVQRDATFLAISRSPSNDFENSTSLNLLRKIFSCLVRSFASWLTPAWTKNCNFELVNFKVNHKRRKASGKLFAPKSHSVRRIKSFLLYSRNWVNKNRYERHDSNPFDGLKRNKQKKPRSLMATIKMDQRI